MRTDVRLGTIPYEALHGVVGATRRRANRGRHEILMKGMFVNVLGLEARSGYAAAKRVAARAPWSFATKLVARGNVIELENFASRSRLRRTTNALSDVWAGLWACAWAPQHFPVGRSVQPASRSLSVRLKANTTYTEFLRDNRISPHNRISPAQPNL